MMMKNRYLGVVLIVAMSMAAGCSNATEGALSGAGIGALSGLAIGSLTGSAGKGAAIGAVVGGVGGAVIGDQNKRKAEAAQASQNQPPPSQTVVVQPQQTTVIVPAQSTVVVQRTYNTGSALGRLVGQWRVSGTIQTEAGGLAVYGTARSSVDKVYFLKTDLRFNDPRTGEMVEGTSVISQGGNRTLEMTNSFSTSPEVKHFRGEVDQSGSVLSFRQTDPGATSRQVIIRLSGNSNYSADVWDGAKRVESYEFSPTAP